MKTAKVIRDRPSCWAIMCYGFAMLLVLSCNTEGQPASDEQLVRYFKEHRESCIRVMEMMEEDHLIELTSQFAKSETGEMLDWGRKELSGERWNSYRRLLRDLGLANGVLILETNLIKRQILFRVSNPGGPSDTEEKGIVYAQDVPAPILDSLDSWHDAAAAYRHLEGNWYIYWVP